MTRHSYYFDTSFVAALYPLVGIYRHYAMLCRPGMYRVVFRIDEQWGAQSADAVCDDFGDLVKVPEA